MRNTQVLCDRLGIFVDGRLVCGGAPKEIASRYGKYLVRLHVWAALQRPDALMARLCVPARTCRRQASRPVTLPRTHGPNAILLSSPSGSRSIHPQVFALDSLQPRPAVQVLTVTTSASAEDLVATHELVTAMAPSARRTYAVGGTQKYELPTAEVTLSQVSGIACVNAS